VERYYAADTGRQYVVLDCLYASITSSCHICVVKIAILDILIIYFTYLLYFISPPNACIRFAPSCHQRSNLERPTSRRHLSTISAHLQKTTKTASVSTFISWPGVIN